MRLMSLTVLLMVIAGCRHYETTVIEGAGGEDARAVQRIDKLYVLPVKLPDEILGDATDAQKQAWREEWPKSGARLVAAGLTEETKGSVQGLVVADVPVSGYYVVITATRIDVGDKKIPATNFINPRPDLRTDVRADCVIINAETGGLVGELSFDLGTAHGIDKPVENDFYNLGKSLGQWLDERQ